MTDQNHTTAPVGGWPLGCQARPWLQAWGREAFAARLPDAMAAIAAIGYHGFETALTVLPLDDPQSFREAAARANDLVLCGAHAGGRWWDEAGAEGIAPIVEGVRRLPALGCQQLIVSMQPLPPGQAVTDAQLDRLTANLSQLGHACREAAGVRVAFHNHASELADDARIIAAIVERCAPEDVLLAPDLGWVAHGGMDPAAFIERFGARIAYLHWRDVTGYGREGGFVETGRGLFDHRALLGLLAAEGYNGWLVAESEFNPEWRGLTEPEATARAQYEGLRRVTSAAVTREGK